MRTRVFTDTGTRTADQTGMSMLLGWAGGYGVRADADGNVQYSRGEIDVEGECSMDPGRGEMPLISIKW